MSAASLAGDPTREDEFLFADGQIAAIEDLGDNVHAVFELELDEVRLAVFHFVQSGFFPGVAADVGEGVVVIDRGNQKRLATSTCVERVVEPEFGGVFGTKAVHLLRYTDFGGTNTRFRLYAKRLQFFLVGFRFARAHVALEASGSGAFLGFDEEFQVRLSVRLATDLRQQEGIDVSACGDEVEVAANAGLSRVDVTEVVRAVDDPEFAVAGGEIEDLLVVGEYQKRRIADFGADGDDVLPGHFDD